MLRVFVINLDESFERRASFTAQLERLDVVFTRFEAVQAVRGARLFVGCDERRYLANTGRTASPQEVACFASHRCLWLRCVELCEPVVILEDDGLFMPFFPAALAAAATLIDRYGFIRLQAHGPSRHIRVARIDRAGDFGLDYYSSYPFGAMAYAIGPRVAAAFSDKSRVMTGPVDVFIRRFWEHGQPLFGLSPSPVEGSELCSRSTIEQRDKPAPSINLRVRRWCNKLRAIVERARFNRAFRAGRSSLHSAAVAGDLAARGHVSGSVCD